MLYRVLEKGGKLKEEAEDVVNVAGDEQKGESQTLSRLHRFSQWELVLLKNKELVRSIKDFPHAQMSNHRHIIKLISAEFLVLI